MSMVSLRNHFYTFMILHPVWDVLPLESMAISVTATNWWLPSKERFHQYFQPSDQQQRRVDCYNVWTNNDHDEGTGNPRELTNWQWQHCPCDSFSLPSPSSSTTRRQRRPQLPQRGGRLQQQLLGRFHESKQKRSYLAWLASSSCWGRTPDLTACGIWPKGGSGASQIHPLVGWARLRV